MNERKEQRRHNSTYPKGGVSCFADTFVVAESSVLRMKICGKNPALRVASYVPASVIARYTWDNMLQKDRKKKRYNEQPTHKTAHLQTAPTDTRPKFAKELFSCLHTRG